MYFFFTCVGQGGGDKPAWTACSPGVKITGVGGKISWDSLLPGEQAHRGWLAHRGKLSRGQDKLGDRVFPLGTDSSPYHTNMP